MSLSRVRSAAPMAILAAVMMLAGCGAPGTQTAGAGETVPRVAGPAAPPLELSDLAGRPVSLQQLRGRPVVVNFWATWCGPCRRELPSLIELHHRFEKQNLSILAVSIDADGAALDGFVAAFAIPFTVLRDPDSAAAARYGVTTVPSTFLLDAAGHVAERIDGEVDWTRSDLLEEVQRLLMEAASGAGEHSG